MEIQQSASVHMAVYRQTNIARVDQVPPPPEGGLPGSQQLLSQLTPTDRAAIAGVTGYQLSPNGQVLNAGGVPPWTFIMAYAAARTADKSDANPEEKPEDNGHVDVKV